MNISIPIDNTMEIIDGTQISPLVTKCRIKVCYVGQQPNRNDTVITREVATELGRKLPGSPIVGYFNDKTQDFEGHEREIIVKDGQFQVIEKTKPYGFVPTNANVWFEKFVDGDEEHEYVVTEGYLWTSAYPEAQRVIEHGNNQSMELDKDAQSGFWTDNVNSGKRIFIYNEALVEKLCILGQEVEPCFEGAQITAFSLSADSLAQDTYSMMVEIQEILNKGGSQESMENEKDMTVETETQDFACGGASSTKETQKKKQEYEVPEDKKEEKKNDEQQEEQDKKKEKYNLADVTEYAELMAQYTALQNQFSALQQEKAALEEEANGLRQFKLSAERQSKQSMVDSFYMLSDEDKKDVVEHLDTYSLDDIEAKLSIICVRNKVNFNLEENKTEVKDASPQGLFNLNGAIENDSAPDWLRAVRETAKNQ